MDRKVNKPKITVYIVSHNYGEYLGDAIESVLRQTVDDWELLIIDDNSSDNTAEAMNLYKGDPRIRLYRTEGIGLPAVCNLALKEAEGKYIIRLDGDDVFDENILLVLSNYLDKHEDIVLVFPDYFLIDEYGEIFAHERRRKLYTENHQLDMPPNGACTMIRIEIIKKLGGYREDIKAQDGFDIWSKLRGNYKGANVNLPLFYYRRHHRNLTNNIHHILTARRQIKYDSILDDLNKLKPCIAIIPSRKYYDFREDLWKERIKGKSLLQRAIETCLSSDIFDHIVVASDNPEVNDVINLFDDSRLSFFLRETRDTIRSQKLSVTLEKVIAKLDPEGLGVTVISYPQSPFVTKGTLEEAVFTLIMNQADSSIGVEEIKNPIYQRTPNGLQPVNPPKTFSTDFDTLFRETNTVIATRNRNLKKGSLTGSLIANFLLSPDECFFVNSERNLKMAKVIAEDN